MKAVWKHRPSPAMVIAILALIVALGGTGSGATIFTNSSAAGGFFSFGTWAATGN